MSYFQGYLLDAVGKGKEEVFKTLLNKATAMDVNFQNKVNKPCHCMKIIFFHAPKSDEHF